MHSSISSTSNVTHNTREIVDVQPHNKVIYVEKVHVEKNILITNFVHAERLNYIYNFQHTTIYQPVHQLGNTINIAT